MRAVRTFAHIVKTELAAIPIKIETAERVFIMLFRIVALGLSLLFLVMLYQELDQEGGIPSFPIPHTTNGSA